MNTIGSVVTLAAFALLLGGCGEAGDTASTSGDSPSSAAAAPRSSDRSGITYAVVGVVRDAQGNPVRGVNVAMTSLDEPGNPVPELAVLTDERGRYRWPASVSPGRYELLAATPKGRASTMVHLSDTKSVTADLKLMAE
jgi:protocatechuate 3,4-dioxygenase beta subunit